MYAYRTEFNHDHQVCLVKEKTAWTGRTTEVYRNPNDIYGICTGKLRMDIRTEESVICLCLDSASHLVGYFQISTGTVDQCLVTPREVYQKALLAGAVGIIVVHNHPSGVASPSDTDYLITDRLAESGKIIGIPLMDHLIIGNQQYYSFREQSPEILEVTP